MSVLVVAPLKSRKGARRKFRQPGASPSYAASILRITSEMVPAALPVRGHGLHRKCLEGDQRLANGLALPERSHVRIILMLKREDVAGGLRWVVFLMLHTHGGLTGVEAAARVARSTRTPLHPSLGWKTSPLERRGGRASSNLFSRRHNVAARGQRSCKPIRREFSERSPVRTGAGTDSWRVFREMPARTGPALRLGKP